MAIIKIVGQNYKLSLVTALTIVGMGIFFALITILILPRFGVMQKQVDKVNGVTRENLTGLRVVRAYNAEDYQEKKFDKANNDLTKTWLFVNRVMILMDPMMTLVMNGINLGIVWFGAYLMSTNQAVIADLTTFTMYSMQIIISVIMIVSIFIFVPRAFVSAKRVFAVLDTPLSIHDGEGIPPEKQGSVEFRDVCFKYPDAEEYVLSNISFRAEKGETVAFIGSTGSGKSTLIKMIPRFYDAIEGEILIDGSNIKDFKLSELRKRIGYVPQRGILFSGTIRSNIEFGDTPEDEEMMKKAADIACATEFISQRQDEFDAPIAQGGTNVSGGQKQRLSIARALARKPEIMVFDDSFSALDFKTDKLVRSNLKQNTDATILIVAQRIGTIKNADRIIVLDQGRIVGNGKHSDLLQSCKIYREIAQSQLSKEELA
jgi:ATP-binding cassette subfamily B protein